MAKKKTRKRRVAKKKTRTTRATRGLSNASVAALQTELNRRLSKLHDRRAELQSEIDEIDALMGDFDGKPTPKKRRPGRPKGSVNRKKVTRKKKTTRKKATARRGRGRPPGSKTRTTTKKRSTKTAGGRPRNQATLADTMQSVLKGKTMGVAEISDAVQKAGYKTTSPNFRNIVNQTLLANKKQFKRVDRGQYTAK